MNIAHHALATPSIFILSSGMLFERTPSNDLAQYLVDQAKHGIFLVGFAKEDSPGGQLIAAAAVWAHLLRKDHRTPPMWVHLAVGLGVIGIATIEQDQRQRMLILIDIEKLMSSAEMGLISQNEVAA